MQADGLNRRKRLNKRCSYDLGFIGAGTPSVKELWHSEMFGGKLFGETKYVIFAQQRSWQPQKIWTDAVSTYVRGEHTPKHNIRLPLLDGTRTVVDAKGTHIVGDVFGESREIVERHGASFVDVNRGTILPERETNMTKGETSARERTGQKILTITT